MASLKSHATVTPSWKQYEVDENETLLSISVKFDTSADIIKRKNKIRDTSELWMGRVILVPENTEKVKNEASRIVTSSPDPEDQDPEQIGFIKLDAHRLRIDSGSSIDLKNINYKNEISGVLLVTPSAIMFDPTNNLPDQGLIIPVNKLKRAALYNVNNNSDDKISWLQVSSGTEVAYFGVDFEQANPLLRCLQKWSSAKHLATPMTSTSKSKNNFNTNQPPDFAVCSSSLELEKNEEFYSSVETEWQIESKVEFENFKAQNPMETAAGILPELSRKSTILSDAQIMNLNNLLPAKCIGSKWNLRYSTRINGTSLKTLIRNCEPSESPNLIVIKTCCNSIIGALASHSIRVSEHFFGSGQSFLFRFQDSGSSELEQFKWSGLNSFFIRCDRETLVFGSSEGSYGIWIEGTLLRGTSRKSETFNNPILTKQRDFKIDTVELWDFS